MCASPTRRTSPDGAIAGPWLFADERGAKRINPGSKSDHEAVVLVCRGEFKLRRKGGPPFGDEERQRVVGRRIGATGLLSAGQFIVESLELVGDPRP